MLESLYVVWMAVMAQVAPHEPRGRLEELARVVAEATPHPVEQAVLLNVDFHETTWGRRGIRFGLSGIRDRLPLRAAVGVALRSLRRARDLCSRGDWSRVDRILGHYHHGAGCAPDAYSRGEAAFNDRLQRLYWLRYVELSPWFSLSSWEDQVSAWIWPVRGISLGS